MSNCWHRAISSSYKVLSPTFYDRAIYLNVGEIIDDVIISYLILSSHIFFFMVTCKFALSLNTKLWVTCAITIIKIFFLKQLGYTFIFPFFKIFWFLTSDT